jgi:hypothetical protein
LLESLTQMVPASLENLSGLERSKVYGMLRLRVTPTSEGYEATGAFCTIEPCCPQLSEGTKLPELRFRALLTEGGTERLELASV